MLVVAPTEANLTRKRVKTGALGSMLSVNGSSTAHATILAKGVPIDSESEPLPITLLVSDPRMNESLLCTSFLVIADAIITFNS
jgi:hypothetical protein